jgi:hypothetical protein
VDPAVVVDEDGFGAEGPDVGADEVRHGVELSRF